MKNISKVNKSQFFVFDEFVGKKIKSLSKQKGLTATELGEQM